MFTFLSALQPYSKNPLLSNLNMQYGGSVPETIYTGKHRFLKEEKKAYIYPRYIAV
jgi:hypothetical protein